MMEVDKISDEYSPIIREDRAAPCARACEATAFKIMLSQKDREISALENIIEALKEQIRDKDYRLIMAGV